MRIAPATAQADLASGRLVAALLDWEMMDPRHWQCISDPNCAGFATARLRRLRRRALHRACPGDECQGQASADGRPAWHQGKQPARLQLVEPPLSPRAQSMLAPVSRTNCTYCASAWSIRSRVWAGDRRPPTMSRRSISCLNSADCAACAAKAVRSTISAGSRGAQDEVRGNQRAADTPDSASVGTVGSAKRSFSHAATEHRQAASLTCATLALTGSTATWIRPSSRSGSSWGAPCRAPVRRSGRRCCSPVRPPCLPTRCSHPHQWLRIGFRVCDELASDLAGRLAGTTRHCVCRQSWRPA